MAGRMSSSAHNNDGAEDHFDQDEDFIHSYGSTIESTPLKPKKAMISADSIVVKIEDKYKEKFLERLKIPDDVRIENYVHSLG